MIQNLELYRSFYYTASLGSFSAAAEALFITQSAVSQAVKKLEQELECKLFERSHFPVQPTRDGVILMGHVSKAFAELQSAEQELMHRREQRKWEWNIGATETALYYGLPEKIQMIQKHQPELKVNLCGSTTPELLSMLQNETLEAAFLIMTQNMLREKQLQGLTIKHITKIQDRPVAASNLGLRPDKKYSLRELMDYSFISLNEKNSVRHLFSQWFLQNGFVFEPQFTVNSTAEVLKMVECGLGIGILPEQIIERKRQSGELLVLEVESLPEPRELILAVKQGKKSLMTESFLTRMKCEDDDEKERRAEKVES